MFINSPDYSVATVDTTNILKALNVSGLTCQKLVYICDQYKVWGSTNNKHNSLADLASDIIYPYYMNMKDESKKDKNTWQSGSDQRLDEEHVKYTGKDMYRSYKIYRQIVDMRKCHHHAQMRDQSTEQWREHHKKWMTR
ncbi:putative ubiquitin-conjugating enzyme E2 26 [Hordeum vulgare]|nr:putative ubiquitin-conjugating enzyme E2 26 [Hordeum vulgare]